MSGFIFGVSFSFFGSAPANAPGVHVTFWIVLIVAGFVCAVAGVLIGAPTLRLKSDYLALVTLGFGEIIPQFFRNGDNIFGHNLTNGTKGITPIDQIAGPGFKLGPFDLQLQVPASCASWSAFVVFVSLAAARRPARPCLAGDPRGRAGRQHDGRAADADQAGRVRRRRRAPAGSAGWRSPRTSTPSSRTASTSPSRSSCWPWSCSAAWATSGA